VVEDNSLSFQSKLDIKGGFMAYSRSAVIYTNLWNVILQDLGKNGRDILTYRLDGKPGVLFHASVGGCCVVVDYAKKSRRQNSDSRITVKRTIQQEEFCNIASCYDDWRNKTVKRSDIVKTNQNTSYIFGLVHHYTESKESG
jgi:hypothetical protein